MRTLPKFRMFRIFLNTNSISYSFRSIANQNGVRYSECTSYFKKYSSSKCKQTVCLHYGLDFPFKMSMFKLCYWCCTVYMKQYYTSNSNCPIRKLSLCHVSMKLIAISRLTSSIREPAVLLTMFHPMFPGEHGVEHYSRKPRETTRMTTTWPTKYK
jgi:hypothetical protein